MTQFRVFYRERVEEDFHGLPRNMHRRVRDAINDRLGTAPDHYGMRLRQDLSGLWRLRVGDYRVAYEISGNSVVIWAVVNRRDAYEEIARRWAR